MKQAAVAVLQQASMVGDAPQEASCHFAMHKLGVQSKIIDALLHGWVGCTCCESKCSMCRAQRYKWHAQTWLAPDV